MKKILFAMYDMHCGGVEKALSELLNVLSEDKDWEITLLLLDIKGEFLKKIPDSVKTVRCDLPDEVYLSTTKTSKEAIGYCLNQGKFLICAKLLYKILINKRLTQQEVIRRSYKQWEQKLPMFKGEYDIAVDFQGLGVFTWFYVAEKVKAKKKATWVHNDVSVLKGNMDWQKNIYEKYDRVYCVSKQATEVTAKHLPFLKDKIDVFYNIISKEDILWLSKADCEELSGKFKILTVGRLSYQKGYDIALKAMARLKAENYDFVYYIVGDGEEHDALETQIKAMGLEDNVRLLGYQENPYKYLSRCDIYLQPSRFEGFCITLAEAKLLLKPIITTDFAGAREQIKNEKTGIIISCNEEDMLNSLRGMMNDEKLRAELAENLKRENSELKTDCRKLKELL